jgi:hypothetical protein
MVPGYYQTGDNGAGNYIVLGQQPTVCSGYLSTSTNMTGTVGTSTINFNSPGPYPTGLTIGELVSGSGGAGGTTIQVLPGSEIASITVGGSPSHIESISITLPLTGTPNATVTFSTLTITASNGGTLITDSYNSPGGANCYQKTNYRGDPHEFGAYGDGKAHGGDGDTVAIQNWLGAYGNVSSLAPTAAPANFGPWIASIPATYLVYQPLVCPPYANLQAGANISAGQPGNGAGGPNPLVIIQAAAPGGSGLATLQNTLAQPALMMASQYCRISGIALDANGNGNFGFPGLGGSAGASTGTTVTLSSAPPAGVVPGMPLYDSGGCIPNAAVITAVNNTLYTLTISLPATGSCSSDSITITGFYAVDVVGTHVGIDNHTLIKNGYYNIHCGDFIVDGLQVKESQIYGAVSDGIHLGSGCSDIRIIGDIVQKRHEHVDRCPR